MKRALLLAGVALALQGCTLSDVKPPSSSTPKSTPAPAAPAGYRQSGTMHVGGQEVPVYSEIARGEGQSAYRMALNPATGKVQSFFRDEVGNVIWKPDDMEASAPGGK